MFQIACCIYVSLWLLLLVMLLPQSGKSEVLRQRMTIFVEPGRIECYHQPVADTEHIILEFQVIHGGQGEAHINFNIMDPHRQLLVSENKQQSGKYNLLANETGIYKLCFDNTISSFNQKIVVFDLEIAAGNHEELERQRLIKDMTIDYHFDRSYTHMHNYVTKIGVNIMRSRQTQDYIRALEAKDRKLVESSYSLVNNWSYAQLIAMIVVGMLQVFMLKSIFKTDGRIYKLWKKI